MNPIPSIRIAVKTNKTLIRKLYDTHFIARLAINVKNSDMPSRKNIAPVSEFRILLSFLLVLNIMLITHLSFNHNLRIDLSSLGIINK